MSQNIQTSDSHTSKQSHSSVHSHLKIFTPRSINTNPNSTQAFKHLGTKSNNFHNVINVKALECPHIKRESPEALDLVPSPHHCQE